ncbi:hypothetical protein B7P43_G14253 [Cryptotermes secundus]|uniref:Uncharacterized protein n=1 Tax=Cryptotermes secundus TaxID=105785 RepID=A0A2J7PH72_9NEOP|nr:hypothetical protein B7P43_G14253 [Cryptotermes secundus]
MKRMSLESVPVRPTGGQYIMVPKYVNNSYLWVSNGEKSKAKQPRLRDTWKH